MTSPEGGEDRDATFFFFHSPTSLPWEEEGLLGGWRRRRRIMCHLFCILLHSLFYSTCYSYFYGAFRFFFASPIPLGFHLWVLAYPHQYIPLPVIHIPATPLCTEFFPMCPVAVVYYTPSTIFIYYGYTYIFVDSVSGDFPCLPCLGVWVLLLPLLPPGSVYATYHPHPNLLGGGDYYT